MSEEFTSDEDMGTKSDDSTNNSSEADVDDQSCNTIEFVVCLRKEKRKLSLSAKYSVIESSVLHLEEKEENRIIKALQQTESRIAQILDQVRPDGIPYRYAFKLYESRPARRNMFRIPDW